MKQRKKTAISPTREEDFSQWYQEVIQASELAEHSPVRGCMTVRPNGFAIWENIQKILDEKFKRLGIENAYFPLLIPLSFLEKEAEHVEGFATETAVVTHTRLEKGKDNTFTPTSPLEEPLIIRPTSETIIGESFSRWIDSYRDLPLKINQWCNVMRWEMRPRLFLRTAEFLWQEAHTAHATAREAQKQAQDMLQIAVDLLEETLAIPVFQGEKSEGERFPGAVATYTIEAMMQDGKALQCGTSHYMGDHFARASNIQYLSKEGKQEYAHTTSLGLTTRLIGAIIMVHGDDNGIIQPPKIAKHHIQIIPYAFDEDSAKEVYPYCEKLQTLLEEKSYAGQKIRVHLDKRELRAGEKSWDAVKKGVPIRLEIGKRDIQEGTIPVFLRTEEKTHVQKLSEINFLQEVENLLDQVHKTLFSRAQAHQKDNTLQVSSLEDFAQIFQEKKSPKFVLAPYKGNKSLEEEIQKKYGVTIRCLPHNRQSAKKCLFTEQQDAEQALFAKSY